MRNLLVIDAHSSKRLVMAGVLLAGGFCFLMLLTFAVSKESFSLPIAVIVVIWFGILAVSRPAAALTVYVVLAVSTMRFQFLVLRGKSIAGGIYLSEALLAALLLGWVMRAAARQGRERRSPFPLLLPLLGLALVPYLSVLSAYVTWDPEIPTLHRKLVVQFAGASLIFLAAAAVMLTSGVITKVSYAKTLVAILMAISIFSFLDVFRVLSTPGKALIFTTAPLAFSFALHARRNLHKFLWLLLLVPPFLIAIQAIKVTLLVALLVPLLFISLGHSRRAFLRTLGALTAGYLIFGVALGHSPGLRIYEKAVMMKDFDRIPLFEKAVGTWKSHPLFGVGPGGQFAYLGGEHSYGTTHSLYGNFLMETGVVGMIFLFWTIGAAVSLGWKTYRYHFPPQPGPADKSEQAFVRAFCLGQTGGFLGMAVAGLFSDTMLPAIQNGGMFMFGASVHLWIFLGITAAFRRMQLEGKIAPLPEGARNRSEEFLPPPFAGGRLPYPRALGSRGKSPAPAGEIMIKEK